MKTSIKIYHCAPDRFCIPQHNEIYLSHQIEARKYPPIDLRFDVVPFDIDAVADAIWRLHAVRRALPPPGAASDNGWYLTLSTWVPLAYYHRSPLPWRIVYWRRDGGLTRWPIRDLHGECKIQASIEGEHAKSTIEKYAARNNTPVYVWSATTPLEYFEFLKTRE